MHEVIVFFSYENDVDISNNIHFLIFFSKASANKKFLPSLPLSVSPNCI